MKGLEAYLKKEPEIVFEWHDKETDAVGWIVINSLRNGAAGGGTRMRKGLTKDEVLALAKVMEIKFSVAGPDIGGAKSGINFDPNDPRKDEVLERWFKAAFPLLKNYYGTGGDLNVDEIRDVIPITEKLGLEHPQEGVLNGHFNYDSAKRGEILKQLQDGCVKVVRNSDYAPAGSENYAVADMITGYGVAESVRHFYDIQHGKTLKGKRVIIQGWGNVASSAGYHLSKNGALIVGILDVNGGIISDEGLGFQEVEKLFLEKDGNKLNSTDALPFNTVNEKIWDVACDIFIPAAASRLVTRSQVDRLIAGGIEVIACGANVPFVDDEILYGPTAQYADTKISLLPDFIVNSGMARTFAYLMEGKQVISDEGIFNDVSNSIKKALSETLTIANKERNISSTAINLSLEKLLIDF